MRFLCRWHARRSRVPSQRPIGLAIAIVIVGGSLLETGAIARTPIESNDSPAPIAAVTGSGDALVAMAAPDPGAPVAPRVDAPRDLRLCARHGRPRTDREPRAHRDARRVGRDRAAPRRAGAPPSGCVRSMPDGPAEFAAPHRRPSTRRCPLRHGWCRTTGRDRAGRRAGAGRQEGVGQDGTRGRRRRSRAGGASPGRGGTRRASPGTDRASTAIAPRAASRYTRYVAGVAHRTLPCGTLVQFRWQGRTAVAPVIDRGPYGGPRPHLRLERLARVQDVPAQGACATAASPGRMCATAWSARWTSIAGSGTRRGSRAATRTGPRPHRTGAHRIPAGRMVTGPGNDGAIAHPGPHARRLRSVVVLQR